MSPREIKQRLSRFLLNEAKRRDAISDEVISFELLMTNNQISARIGTGREVVSRALSRLQTEGLIALENRRIAILSE
ncbi:MAG: helix-turn-helix domain-containing protein [Pyrinomonadaceae bacterium]